MIDASSPEALAASLTELATAYAPGAVIGAAVELGLFAHLREPREAALVARAIEADEDGVGRLLRALVALGLVERDDEGCFSCPHADVLGPEALGATFAHHRRHIAPLFEGLAEAIQRGRRPHQRWGFVGESPEPGLYRELARHQAEYDVFLRAMDRASAGVGHRLAEVVDLGAAGRLIDLGGGGGGVARELLARAPSLLVDGLDLAPACRHAERRAEEAGLGARHRLIEGDLRAPLSVEPAPLVLLSAVLADFPPAERLAVLREASRCLAPGGRLLISETLLDVDRAGPPRAAMLSLMSFAAFGGDQLSEPDVHALLEEADFVVEAVHRGAPRDLVIAARA